MANVPVMLQTQILVRMTGAAILLILKEMAEISENSSTNMNEQEGPFIRKVRSGLHRRYIAGYTSKYFAKHFQIFADGSPEINPKRVYRSILIRKCRWERWAYENVFSRDELSKELLNFAEELKRRLPKFYTKQSQNNSCL